MKILTSVITILMVCSIAIPVGANFFGFGLKSIPNLATNTNNTCPNDKKDKYGRCPFTGRSAFRTISISNSTGGSGGFGGSK